ncbi:HAD family hydrolase [Shimia marina]|uniref:phosphoglycolate phosphatase n=1 Tax=Shimia marina TaxID=321267 RepID=A0A0P1FEH5_9RHOB|nr:HAD family phosphatase [Shimia marina]CUH52662.1 6-phosphogluconate phosphatase [Shimia marina]SFE67475.1 haloacid dehalogenase superfamily, subfamily IA, variant 3 with third motif having DD or ED [Shimia marina]
MPLLPDLVLFDCDGVLVDSERLTNRVIHYNLKARGLFVPEEEIITLFVGGTMQGVYETARARGAVLEPDWVARIYEEVFAALAKDVTPIPGIVEVLDWLDQAAIPYAVCSNGPHAKMDVTLARCGLKARFEGRIYSREDVTTPKPAPDVYLLAAQRAGIAPARCVVIEDSPNGATAGKAAGMYTLGYCADMPAARLAPICDQLFEDMRALPAILKCPTHPRAVT